MKTNCWWALAAILIAAGCGNKATQVIVTVDAEDGVRMDSARLHLVVLGGLGRTTAPTASRFDRVVTPGDGDSEYPFKFVLAPLDRDVGRSFSVTATAETEGGDLVAQARIIGGYVEGETLTVRVLLEDACRGVMCGDEQSCKAGVCVDARTQTAVDAGALDAGDVDAGSGDDGGDAGTGDAGTNDAATADAGSDMSVSDGGPVDAGDPCALCDDGNPCTADTCVSRACVHMPEPEGLDCDTGAGCYSGVCSTRIGAPIGVWSFGPDVNGDGRGDIAFGAPGASARPGRVVVRSGSDGAILYEVAGSADSGDDSFGGAVSLGPDVDGDGRGDLIVGAPAYFGPGTSGTRFGRVTVVSGATGGLLSRILVPDETRYFGAHVSLGPDFDGDGRGDFAVSTENASFVGSLSGAVYLYSGASRTLLRRIDGSTGSSLLGSAVCVGPDVDGDGRADVLAAAGVGTLTDESAVLFSGATGAIIRRFVGSVPGGEQFGLSVSLGGDLDGDGRGDVLVGAPSADASGLTDRGRATLFSGASGAVLRTVLGVARDEMIGQIVNIGPDASGDGVPDFLVGAGRAARLDLFDGASGALIATFGAAQGQLGPDVDGDGLGDVAYLAGTGDVVIARSSSW